MNESTEKKMYIITADCYQCEEKLNIAVIRNGKTSEFSGPENFTQKEIKLAQESGVIIEMCYSKTRQENYLANICPHCKVFVGQHFLFTEYFVEAMNGYFEFKTVDLN